MMMTDLHKELREAQRAKDSLEYLEEVFDTLEKELVQSWLEAPVRDTEGREGIWLMVKSLHKLQGVLGTKIDTGKLASHQLEQERKAKGEKNE